MSEELSEVEEFMLGQIFHAINCMTAKTGKSTSSVTVITTRPEAVKSSLAESIEAVAKRPRLVKPFKCLARSSAGGFAQDCDYPHCGCEP